MIPSKLILISVGKQVKYISFSILNFFHRKKVQNFHIKHRRNNDLPLIPPVFHHECRTRLFIPPVN